jgi:NNP family nitrate/nitrite transporter-like MFS transporter
MLLLFFNFLTRGLFSPLLPLIEHDFGISHAKASRLFLILQIGFSGSMVFSGYVSKTLHHRGLILLYESLLGLALVACALSNTFLLFRISIFFLGISAGLYAPSGLASLTSLVHQRHWGKAMGIHELPALEDTADNRSLR